MPDPTTLLFGEALSLLLTQNERLAERKELRVCEQGREKQSECVRKRHRRQWRCRNRFSERLLECKEERKRRIKLRFLRRSRNAGLCGHLNCSRCACCSGWGTAGVQHALLLWRNLTRPRKSSAAYSTQRSGLIASLAFPVTKSHPSATQGSDHNNRQLSPFLCLLL